jgi:TonB family protein
VSSSWSSGFERLSGPLAVSFGLHLATVAALDALPQRAGGELADALQRGGKRLQVALRAAPPPPAALEPAPASLTPSLPPLPPVPPPPLASALPPAGPAAETADSGPLARYFLARELDARPVPLAPIEPAYPNDAYLRNIPGSVLVQLHLNEAGNVERAEILRAHPPGYFEEAVRLAFLGARFSPGIRGGQPVRVRMTVEIRYHGQQQELPAAAGAAPVPGSN